MARARAAVLIAVVVAVMPVGRSAAAPLGAPSSRRGHHAVCGPVPARFARCHSHVVDNGGGVAVAAILPGGLSPATIKSAYSFPSDLGAGTGKTVAIVDAFDDPTAENDLGVFDQTYGLPACTTANGCFTKVDQTGGTRYPRANSGWALEISLDVQWAHAIAPGAKILLVEATTNFFSDLFTAEDYAKSHAQYVSNSWTGPESSFETIFDSHFAQSGVSFFVAAGDTGLPAEYPSASPNVISVGGTTLHFDGGGHFVSETGWSGGGGGCSLYETAASPQSGFPEYGQAGCGGKRATPDVSLDADPASGVAVYDSTPDQGQSGWFIVGGTSASSPMWAARAADTGGTVDAGYVYANSIAFRDITTGNNGAPCLVGYDLCTGRGSWTASSSTSFTTNWTSTENPRVLQSAAYLNMTPEQLQKGGVQLIAFFMALVPPPGPTPLIPPPSNTGTVSYTTNWAPSEIPALHGVMAQYSLSAEQAQKLGVLLVSFLLALGGH